jgi:hypothetical protein
MGALVKTASRVRLPTKAEFQLKENESCKKREEPKPLEVVIGWEIG